MKSPGVGVAIPDHVAVSALPRLTGLGDPDTVGAVAWNPTVTSCSEGVTVVSDVVNVARYTRYRLPVNWASDAPPEKVVPLVPSGPTNENGPEGLSLAAAWNETPVEAGVSAVHDSVSHPGELPGRGLASLSDDTRVPADL